MLGRVEAATVASPTASAILYAVQQAQPGDVVGVWKGHEQSMCFGTVEHPWRNQDALAWALIFTGPRSDQPPFVLPTW